MVFYRNPADPGDLKYCSEEELAKLNEKRAKVGLPAIIPTSAEIAKPKRRPRTRKIGLKAELATEGAEIAPETVYPGTPAE